MRKLSFRATALVLSLILTFGPAASASWAMGSKTHVGTTHLAEGVNYTRQYLWSATYSDLRTERYLEYTPNSLVQPMVSYGSYVLSKSTLSAMASALEADGKRVIGGINGDYFVVATGAPLGLVITDGVLRSSSSYLHALGFDAEGNAFIGKPELSITATMNGQTLTVGGLNKVRTDKGGYALYTSDFAASTSHTSPGIDVILVPNTDKLGQSVEADPNADGEIHDTLTYSDVPVIGGRISCTVEQVLHSEGSIPIPQGKLILSIHGESDPWLVSQLTNLQAGDTVDIDFSTPDTRWETAVTAVGGLHKMVTDGVVESGLDAGQAPRTAVGIRADGSVVFYTVDGRQSGYSVGASMTQVAKRLVELGCVEAVCMDGGGSTTLGATLPGQNGFSILSSPSDGVERTISNAIFLVAQQTAPGEPQQLSVNPGDAILFPGSKLRLSAMATDQLGQTVTRYPNNQVTYTVPAEGGTVSNGVLIAGSEAGSYTLEATADGLTGTSRITIIPTPDRLSLRNSETDTPITSLTVQPGQSIRLTVDAVYRNLPMDCQNADFTWGISDNIGTIDKFGNYTAGNRTGTGTITVSAGTQMVSVSVTVTGTIRTLQDFEGDFVDMGGSLTAQIVPENRSDYVRFGRQSARLTYDTAGSEFSAVSVYLQPGAQDRCLNLWVCGDGSGNTLTAPYLQSDGTQSEITLAALNFTGWKQVAALLPVGGGQILTLKIKPTGTAPSGTIWLDQITVSDQIVPDHAAPEITLAITDTTLQAVITDDMNAAIPENSITVTCDGAALPFTAEGTLISAQLPEPDGLAHRLTVTAADASGNISRASADIAATAERELPLADMANHWAADPVVYLYDRGIITGVASDAGSLFFPDNSMTRGEFAVMVSRWLGLDLTEYQDVTLPFADTQTIPDWMLNAVKAMYDLGYMQGSAGPNGLCANATAGITRAEAITLLYRIQPKGYARALLLFDDAADIPVWAQDAVATLVAQGAVGGSGNRFNPGNPITRAEMAKLLSVLW